MELLLSTLTMDKDGNKTSPVNKRVKRTCRNTNLSKVPRSRCMVSLFFASRITHYKSLRKGMVINHIGRNVRY